MRKGQSLPPSRFSTKCKCASSEGFKESERRDLTTCTYENRQSTFKASKALYVQDVIRGQDRTCRPAQSSLAHYLGHVNRTGEDVFIKYLISCMTRLNLYLTFPYTYLSYLGS